MDSLLVWTKHLREFQEAFEKKIVGLFAKKTDVPTRVSDLENDEGYARTESPVFAGTPRAPTPPQDSDDTRIATTAFVKAIINALVGGAPETLDTLEEIADALARNKDVVDALNAAIGKKVDKVSGKGLSTNDFTTAEKDKLAGVADRATANAPSQTVPKANGEAAAGTEAGYSRGDHVHPLQTSVSGNAGTATKLKSARKINGVAFDGTKDITVADGTKVPLSGGRVTGNLVMKNVTLTDGVHDRTVMVVYDDGDGDNDYGSEITIGANGNLFIGSGESYSALRAALQGAVGPGESYSRTSENAYLTADTIMYFYSNCNTIGNRKGFAFDAGGNLRPLINEQHSLGTSAISWLNAFIRNITATVLALKDGGQVRRGGRSGSWYQGRDLAMIRQNSAASGQYLPIFSVKTENGSWEIGPYTGNILHLSYITDADYNAKTNKQTADIQFLPDGSIKVNKINGYTIAASVPAGAKFTDTVYGNMKGATASAAGAAGLVPAPAKGAQLRFLRGDGTWQEMIEATDADIDAIIAGTFK